MVGSGELGLHWEGSDGGFGGAVSSGCFKWKSVLRSLWEAGEGLSTSLARRAGVLWSFCFMWFWGPHLAVLEARFSRVLGDRPAVLGIQQKCPGWRALAESMKQLSGASLTYLVDCLSVGCSFSQAGCKIMHREYAHLPHAGSHKHWNSHNHCTAE